MVWLVEVGLATNPRAFMFKFVVDKLGSKSYHSSVGVFLNAYVLEILFESRGMKLYGGENES